MATTSDTPLVPTRQERLRATFKAWAAWAETATTDEPPGQFPGEEVDIRQDAADGDASGPGDHAVRDS